MSKYRISYFRVFERAVYPAVFPHLKLLTLLPLLRNHGTLSSPGPEALLFAKFKHSNNTAQRGEEWRGVARCIHSHWTVPTPHRPSPGRAPHLATASRAYKLCWTRMRMRINIDAFSNLTFAVHTLKETVTKDQVPYNAPAVK